MPPTIRAVACCWPASTWIKASCPKRSKRSTELCRRSPTTQMRSRSWGKSSSSRARNQEAVGFLQQAVGADPTLQSARTLLGQLGVQVPVAQPVQQPMQQPAQRPPQQGGQPPPLQQPPMRPPVGAPGQDPWASGTNPTLAPASGDPGPTTTERSARSWEPRGATPSERSEARACE